MSSTLTKIGIEDEIIDIDNALNGQTEEALPDTVRSNLHLRRQELLSQLKQFSQQ